MVTGIITTWYNLRARSLIRPPAAPLIGCHFVEKNGFKFPPNFVVLLVFELAVVILTIRRASRGRTSPHPPFGYIPVPLGTPLLRVLYRDSVTFFLVLFAVTLSVILIQAVGPGQITLIMWGPFRAIHSIICCRVVLNLRQVVTPQGPSEGTTLSVFVAAPGGRTEGVETIQLDVYGARSDSEDGSAGGPCIERRKITPVSENEPGTPKLLL